MLKLITSLIPFIKELFFDRKEEMDFTDPSFNPKKWIQYVLFIILFSLVLFVGGRLVGITTKYIKLNDEFKKQEEIVKVYKEKLDTLEEDNRVLKKQNEFQDSHCFPYSSKKSNYKVKKS